MEWWVLRNLCNIWSFCQDPQRPVLGPQTLKTPDTRPVCASQRHNLTGSAECCLPLFRDSEHLLSLKTLLVQDYRTVEPTTFLGEVSCQTEWAARLLCLWSRFWPSLDKQHLMCLLWFSLAPRDDLPLGVNTFSHMSLPTQLANCLPWAALLLSRVEVGWSVHWGYTDQPDSLSRIQISLLKGKVLDLQVWCKGRSVVPLVCSWVSQFFFCSVSRPSHAITNANAEDISSGYKGFQDMAFFFTQWWSRWFVQIQGKH